MAARFLLRKGRSGDQPLAGHPPIEVPVTNERPTTGTRAGSLSLHSGQLPQKGDALTVAHECHEGARRVGLGAKTAPARRKASDGTGSGARCVCADLDTARGRRKGTVQGEEVLGN